MATLQLRQLWINLASTGEGISAATAPGRKRSHALDGDVRTFAGGRQRAIVKEGIKKRFDFTVIRVSFTTLLKLEDWAGQEVQIRDHRGQRFYGMYFEVDTTEYKDPLYAAGITLLGTTEAT